MGYDVQVLGNHEFNYGVDYLKEAIKNYQAPILGANIVNKTTSLTLETPVRLSKRRV